MNVSVIIPAHNAAETIAETLNSLVAQTYPHWEAIVVDDGSTDETAAIVACFAKQDPRIVTVTQPRGGEGNARNAGIALSHFDWLLFLDADDWLAPAALENFTKPLAADPTLDGACGGWARVASDGTVIEESNRPDLTDLFRSAARFCPFAIHSCVVRRTAVEEAGRFEPSLSVGADWDLWQRVARMGARLARVEEVVAYYRMRPDSAVASPRALLLAGLRLIRLGHAEDPRIKHPLPEYAKGLPPQDLIKALFIFACWPAGMLIGKGEDALWVLDQLPEDRNPWMEPTEVAHSIFRSVLVGICRSPDTWVKIWPGLEKPVDEFLTALESRTGTPDLARRTRKVLERLVVTHVIDPPPFTVGSTHVIAMEVTEPLYDVHVPSQVERLQCNIELEQKRLGLLELPAGDGRVPGSILSDAVAAEFAWPILGAFFESGIYPKLEVRRNHSVSVWRGNTCLAKDLPGDEKRLYKDLHSQVGWTVFLQEVWGKAEWPLTDFYNPEAKIKAAESRKVSDNVTTVEVATELIDLEVSGESVDVEFTMGGTPIAFLTFKPIRKQIRSQQLRATLTNEMGFELCRAAVREGLIGSPLNGSLTLRERLARAAKRAETMDGRPIVLTQPDASLTPTWARAVKLIILQDDGGLVLARHAGSASAPSISRRALLPTASAPDLLDAAEAAGQPVIRVAGQGPQRIWYAPDLLWKSCQQTAVKKQASVKAGGKLPAAIARILMRGSEVRKERTPQQVTYDLPILMYHQVAPTGPDYLARYRIRPDIFEEQLRYLHDQGFHTIDLEAWWRAMQAQQPIPGRAVILTFDDGYLDFMKYAWPILKRHSLSAVVFLVAEKIGQTNSWDNIFGEEVPLLGWKDIHQLQDAGVEFGSHTATHPFLTALSPAEVVREAARSRAILERGLKRPVTAFAYPHGSEDQAVQHLIGACGYIFGLSCRPGPSKFHDPLLALPRIEITGSDGLGEFISKLKPRQDLLAT